MLHSLEKISFSSGPDRPNLLNGAKSEQEASGGGEELMTVLVLGVTFPSGEMQQQLVGSLYRECGIKPGDVEYVEAHGTGTKVSMGFLVFGVFLPLHLFPHFPIRWFFVLSK